MTEKDKALIETRNIGKGYGRAVALADVSMAIRPGEVTCVLGDNGAGKSTLINILAGRHAHDAGELLLNGARTRFESPRDAVDAGIATVYQDLALLPLMSVWRNFFLSREPEKGWGPLRRIDVSTARETTAQALSAMGVKLRSVDQPIGSLSGGQRQSVAIARAIHFGAKAIVLDEPTAALGVKQSGLVLRNILLAAHRGLGVVFVTHNAAHALAVGDRFLVLNLGRAVGSFARAEIDEPRLLDLMSGNPEQYLSELEGVLETEPAGSVPAS